MVLKNILLCSGFILSLTPSFSCDNVQEQRGDFSQKRRPLKILQRNKSTSQEIQSLKREQIRLQKENEFLRSLLEQKNGQEDGTVILPPLEKNGDASHETVLSSERTMSDDDQDVVNVLSSFSQLQR
jgi:hypothetical protein